MISPDGPLHGLPSPPSSTASATWWSPSPAYRTLHGGLPQILASRPREPSEPRSSCSPSAIRSPAATGRRRSGAREPQVRSAVRRGLKLTPVRDPRGSEAIARLVPNTRSLLGSAATEEAIKALAPRARRLHFACHGLVDEEHPHLGAGPELAEAPAATGTTACSRLGRSRRAALNADLVTLSACDTARGKEMGARASSGSPAPSSSPAPAPSSLRSGASRTPRPPT